MMQESRYPGNYNGKEVDYNDKEVDYNSKEVDYPTMQVGYNTKKVGESLNGTHKEEDRIWADIAGDETRWEERTTSQKVQRIILNVAKIVCALCCLYLFVCSLGLLSSSFRLISGKSTGAVMNNEYMTNPIVGLMIGILVTVLVQSSSTSTSIIVSMVAAGILNVHDTIPIIMGSNVGTSVTNTIVSLTQIGDPEQFRRAFAGATVHDMFNWLAVLVLLPLEIVTGMLEKMTSSIVNSLMNSAGGEVQLLEVITDPFTDLIVQLDSKIVNCWGMGFLLEEKSMIKKYCAFYPANVTESLSVTTSLPNETSLQVAESCLPSSRIGINHTCQFAFYETNLSDTTVGIILLIVSLTILCTSLIFIVKILNSLLIGSIAKVIKKLINANIPYVPWLTGYVAILIGAILTFIVQSSSVFTSTMTPLIGIGIITLDRAYPLTLGSNIGTTTTALLAAMAAEGDRTNSIQIALVHFFFNVISILIYFPLPFMRWPIPLARGLGSITARYRWFAIFYLISMFFVLPGCVFALSMGGSAVLWGVLAPVLILLAFASIINVLQNKVPHLLPNVMRTWDYLPLPLHSLEPYDKIFTSLPFCSKCRLGDVESNVEKHGIDNPIPIVES